MTTSKRVLVVEDDPKLAEDLVACLNDDKWSVRSGISFAVAHSIQSAQVQLLRKPPFAGVVIDMMLPEDDEAGERLAELEAERGDLLTEWSDCVHSNSSADPPCTELAERIKAIELRIDKLLNPEGGIKILQWLLRQCSPETGEKPRIPVPNGRAIIPVIFLTASSLRAPQRLCSELHIDSSIRYLSKPVWTTDVLLAVQEALKVWGEHNPEFDCLDH